MIPHRTAEQARRASTVLVPVWQHECCQAPTWSATRHCDRCGTVATTNVQSITFAEFMAGRRFSHASHPPSSRVTRPAATPLPSVDPATRLPTPSPQPMLLTKAATLPVAAPPPRCVVPARGDAPDRQPSVGSLDGVERPFVFAVFWLAGVVSALMGIGAFVEFEEASYVESFMLAIGAAATPVSLLAHAGFSWFSSLWSQTRRDRFA